MPPHFARLTVALVSGGCTKTCHPLVDGVHSFESKADKTRRFSLTGKIEGVKRQSFFSNF